MSGVLYMYRVQVYPRFELFCIKLLVTIFGTYLVLVILVGTRIPGKYLTKMMVFGWIFFFGSPRPNHCEVVGVMVLQFLLMIGGFDNRQVYYPPLLLFYTHILFVSIIY